MKLEVPEINPGFHIWMGTQVLKMIPLIPILNEKTTYIVTHQNSIIHRINLGKSPDSI